MDTLYFFRHTSPLTGRRTTTRYRLREVEAQRLLIDPERIEFGALTIEPFANCNWSMPSGLAPRDDGAMVMRE